MIKIRNNEIGTLAICAVRYALGRSTYIVSDVTDILTNHLDELHVSCLQVIKRDIEHAIWRYEVGTLCDKNIWTRLLRNINTFIEGEVE